MKPICNPTDLLPLQFKPHQIPPHPLAFPNPNFSSQFLKPQLRLNNPHPWRRRLKAISADHAEIDMVRNKEGVYAAKPKKVVVLWDLDNKPPRGPPYEAAVSLRQVAQRFGEVVDISAYANRHAFVHLPHWVLEQRRDRRRLNILERQGAVKPPPETYKCGVCGRKCNTNLDLKKHFRQLHEREQQKKINRMKMLKGKKRQRYKERYINGNDKYVEAARDLITPKVGYGLAAELRRAGVYVKTVEDKPQAADWALKRQMQHSLSRGVDWMFLVSDDSDFAEMLRRAREADLGTVVVGDWDKALGRHADLWIPWMGVENGEISEEDLMRRRRVRRQSVVTRFDGEDRGEGSLDSVVEELVALRTDFHNMEMNEFSDGEEEEWVGEEDDGDYEEDGEIEEDDGFFR